MKENHLENEEELQSYFTKRIEKFLSSKGKILIGWDEILEGGIAENAAVMSWRGTTGGVTAASLGHDVVMTPYSHVYLDFYQSPYFEPLAIGGLTDLKKVYSLRLMPDEISEQDRRHILGGQGNVWTEYMVTEEHVEYMIFPRLSALAEVCWTNPSMLDYEDFLLRMNAQYARYDMLGLNYRIQYPAGPKLLNICLTDTITVSLNNDIACSDMYYTIDGSDPGTKSIKYNGPFDLSLEKERIVKAVTILPSGKMSAVAQYQFKKGTMKEAVKTENPDNGVVLRFFKGEFNSVHDLPDKPDSTGFTERIVLPATAPSQLFGIEYEGLFFAEADGIYTFSLSSDDGAVLIIDDELIVDGNITHHGVVNSGDVALRSGMHSILVRYFQNRYRKGLDIMLQAPASTNKSLPAELLFH